MRLKTTKRNPLTLVCVASAPVDEWRVESMNVVVHIVYEKTFSNCTVSVSEGSHVEPERFCYCAELRHPSFWTYLSSSAWRTILLEFSIVCLSENRAALLQSFSDARSIALSICFSKKLRAASDCGGGVTSRIANSLLTRISSS